MIGWKIDLCYSKNNFQDSNIGDIFPFDTFIFTDLNKVFCGLVEKDSSLRPASNVQYNGVTVESRENMISYVQNWLGEDYYNIYCRRIEGSDFNSLAGEIQWVEYSFPTVSAMYPNWTSMEVDNTILGSGYYFKSLDKLLYFQQNTFIRGFKKVNNQWILDLKYQYSYFNSASNFGVGSVLIYKGGQINELSSWCKVTMGYASVIGFRGFRVNAVENFPSGMQNVFTWIFTDQSGNPILPDIEGPVIPPDQPYDPIDPSGPGGGSGTFDDSSDLIPDSPLPTLSSANTGFTRIYNPTLSQVQQLAQYLWTDETLIETLWNKVKQYFEDPMQAIIGFNLVPVPVPDAGTKSFALMYIDTGVDMNVAASQFVDRDCGTLIIEPYYGSALDYAPHTKISIFLPFIGTVQLSTDEVMGRTLQVKYRVDICSGSCVAKVAVDGNFIYQFSGHCAIPIPISSSDFSSYVGAAISVAKLGITAAVGAATGGAGLFATAAAQKTGQEISRTTTTNTVRNPETGRQITAKTKTVEKTVDTTSSTSASFDGISPQNVSNTVGEIMASKPAIEHSGSFSGNTGYLGVRRPFLIIERPNLCLPSDFQKLNGYPSMITMPLSDCTGYTVVQQVQLTGLGATNPEQAEILELLKGGVIF